MWIERREVTNAHQVLSLGQTVVRQVGRLVGLTGVMSASDDSSGQIAGLMVGWMV